MALVRIHDTTWSRLDSIRSSLMTRRPVSRNCRSTEKAVAALKAKRKCTPIYVRVRVCVCVPRGSNIAKLPYFLDFYSARASL